MSPGIGVVLLTVVVKVGKKLFAELKSPKQFGPITLKPLSWLIFLISF